MKTRIAVTAFAAVLCLVSSASAATVTLEMVLDPGAPGCVGCTLSGPGTYNLVATSSAGDNFGIVGYNVPVLDVTSVLHRSPRVSSSENADGDVAPAGFSNFRTGTNQSVIPGGFNISATQDVFTPTPYIIYGFGQTSSSFAAQLPAGNLNSGVIQPSWSDKLVLAEGMYQAGAAPRIDFSSVDISVNVSANGPGQALQLLAAEVAPPPAGDLVPPVITPLVENVAWPNTIANLQLSGSDDTTAAANLVWSALSYSGPGSGDGSNATLTAGGLFSWDPTGYKNGAHMFSATLTDEAGNAVSGLALTVNYTVPEPAVLSLLGLALVGVAGFRRK